MSIQHAIGDPSIMQKRGISVVRKVLKKLLANYFTDFVEYYKQMNEALHAVTITRDKTVRQCILIKLKLTGYTNYEFSDLYDHYNDTYAFMQSIHRSSAKNPSILLEFIDELIDEMTPSPVYFKIDTYIWQFISIVMRIVRHSHNITIDQLL